MHVGMLWYDNDPNTALMTKVEKAAEYYRKKYGQNPDICFVHPSMLGETVPIMNSIAIQSYNMVLPGHLWIGIKDENGSNGNGSGLN